jgi:hypothetical protein
MRVRQLEKKLFNMCQVISTAAWLLFLVRISPTKYYCDYQIKEVRTGRAGHVTLMEERQALMGFGFYSVHYRTCKE